MKNQNSSAERFDFEVRKIKREIENQRTIIDKFSEALKEAALNDSSNVAQICEALIEERSKAQTNLELNQAKLVELEAARIQTEEHS